MINVLLSCEHGGNQVPAELKRTHQIPASILDSHRGLDFGALETARYLARHLGAPLVPNQLTRLAIDFNRSPTHPQLFSKYSRGLQEKQKNQLLEKYYWPYRNKIERQIIKWKKQKVTTLHLSIHSFTPRWKGHIRNGDLAWLYDPSRLKEKKMARDWRRILGEINPQLRLRFNYPYLGIADGLIPWLRKRHSSRNYVGIELEINQSLWRTGGVPWKQFQQDLVRSFSFF